MARAGAESLGRKVLWPLVGGSVTLLAVLLAGILADAEEKLTTQLARRAEVLADAVAYASESMSHVGELARFVSALGGDADVSLIVVVGGTPTRVIVSTRHEWIGLPLEALPQHGIGEDLAEAIRTNRGRTHEHRETEEFDYTAPVLLTQPEFAHGTVSQGAVMVHLLMGKYRAAQAAATRRLVLGALGVVLLTVSLAWWQIHRHVLVPVRAIADAVRRHREKDPAALAPAMSSDELGQLAIALNEAVTTITSGQDELRAAKERAELALVELEHQKFALDQHSIVAVTDVRGRILYANDRFCALSGYSREELMGQDHRLLNSGTHSREFFRDLYRELAGGRVWHGEICNRAKDGTLYWVDSTMVPVPGRDGRPERYIAIRTDVTQRKRVEAQLQRAKLAADQLAQQAQAASKAKSEFLATMSHEIRTPMNSVLGFTELLMDTQLNAEQEEYVRTIRTSGELLLAIIDDILDFSKVEAGKLTLERTSYDLLRVADEVLELLSPRAYDKGLELGLRVSPGTARELVGDPIRVRQVLLNLLGNALKFTARGHLLLDVTADAPGSVRIAVTDTGLGIPAAKLANLFEPFTQADASTTRRFGGTGLGLAICRHLVVAMGGAIGATSEPGCGSTFWFTLPAGSAPPADALPDVLAGARVLVVDGHELARRLLDEQLRCWGLDHELVSTATEALAQLRSGHAAGRTFHIALLDLRLQDMDAEAFVRLARGEMALAATAFIAMPSGRQGASVERLIDAGFAAVLRKPVVRPGHLLEALVAARVAQDAPRPGVAATPAVTPGPVDAASRQTPAGSTPRHRVLVVEDNTVNQRLARHLLARLECIVDVAATGKEAVELTRDTTYDLVFMDCHMPEMDGFEATAQIRARERLARGAGALESTMKTPIVALTASAMDEDREACRAAGMDGVITKPMKPDALRHALAQWARPPPRSA